MSSNALLSDSVGEAIGQLEHIRKIETASSEGITAMAILENRLCGQRHRNRTTLWRDGPHWPHVAFAQH